MYENGSIIWVCCLSSSWKQDTLSSDGYSDLSSMLTLNNNLKKQNINRFSYLLVEEGSFLFQLTAMRMVIQFDPSSS